jgi:hypothetical protein
MQFPVVLFVEDQPFNTMNIHRSCKLSHRRPSPKAVLAYIKGMAREYMHMNRGSPESEAIIKLMVDECKKEGLDQQQILNSVADEIRNARS